MEGTRRPLCATLLACQSPAISQWGRLRCGRSTSYPPRRFPGAGHMSCAPAHAPPCAGRQTVCPSARVCKQIFTEVDRHRFAKNMALRVPSSLHLVPWVGIEGALGPGGGGLRETAVVLHPRGAGSETHLHPAGTVPPRLPGAPGTTPSCPPPSVLPGCQLPVYLQPAT